MINKRFWLNKEKNTYLDVCIPDYMHTKEEERLLPSVMVCPGGGYSICSARESQVVAFHYLSEGFATFILQYSLKENAGFPAPLMDVLHAMQIVRSHGKEWHIDLDKIAVIGFSAGAHLAASLGVYWNTPRFLEQAGCKAEEVKPNALMLIYPVLSPSWCTHDGHLLPHLVGEMTEEETKEWFNLTKHVSKDVPQCFLCHTFRDDSVPVADSLVFAQKLEELDIPFEMHIFPNGHHGLSTGQACVSPVDNDFGQWVNLSVNWLNRKFDHPEESEAPVKHARFNEEYRIFL